MEAVLVLLILLASGNAASFSDNPSEPKSLVFRSSKRFISTTTNVWHMELDQHENDGSILFAESSALKTVTKDKSVSTVVSGFSRLTGFEQLNSTHLTAVDFSAHCVKMVNRVDNSVRVFAGQCGKRGLSDGNPGLFYGPWAVEEDVRHAGKLLITDTYNHALRSVDVNSGVISTVISSGFNQPYGLAWNKDRLFVTNNHYVSEVVWSDDDTVTNTLLAGSTTFGSADGDFTTSRFNTPYDISSITSIWSLVADYYNKKLRLLDVTRREVLPVCTNSLSPCTESTVIGSTFSLLQTADAVYVGGNKQITKLTGSDMFTTTTSPPSNTTRSVCQDRNVTVRVRDGESSATVSTGDGSLLKLEPGHHQYTKYNCTVNVIVVRSASSKTKCPKSITRAASSDTKTAAVEIPGTNKGYKLELPIGQFSLTIPYGSATCDITINVVDPNIRRRVTFQADYDVKCDQAVAAVAKNIIFSRAQQHFEQITNICGKYCKPIVTRKPIIACSNDKLRIQWRTNPVYGGETLDIKPDVKSALKQQVSGGGVSTFSLVVSSKIPPVVYPVRNSDGDSVTFSLTSFCVGNSTYNPQIDRCQ